VAKDRTEQWRLDAEELVRQVRILLDDHGKAVEKALRRSLSRDEAQATIRQLDQLVDALAVELWRKGTPDRSVGRLVAGGLAAVLAAMGLRFVDLGTTDLYEAVRGAKAQADHVVVMCADDVHDLKVDDARQEQTVSEATNAPATVRVRPGDATVTPGGDQPGREVDLRPATSDAVADAFGDLTVTQEGDTSTAEGTVEGAASATYAHAGAAEAAGTALPAEARAVEVGQVVEHDEALPITPVRAASGSRIVAPPDSGGPASADVTGDAATADQTESPEQLKTRKIVDRPVANRVSPYYSANPSDPDVHHVFSDCPNGQQISSYNRRDGTGGYPMCGTCQNMGG
jgi:hypothetical protein